MPEPRPMMARLVVVAPVEVRDAKAPRPVEERFVRLRLFAVMFVALSP